MASPDFEVALLCHILRHDALMPAPASRTYHLLGAVLLVSTLVALAVVWWIGHQATLRVQALTGVPQCQGTTPRTVRDHVTQFEREAIPLRHDFACTITVKVTNKGGREVKLGDMIVPVSGPAGGGSFEVTSIDGIEVPKDDEIDAIRNLNAPLGAGESHWVDLLFEFRPSGCVSNKGQMTIDPNVRVDSLVASHELVVADLPVFVGTADSSCDS